MIWLTAFGALAVGIILGLVIATRLNVSPSKIKDLESQIRQLKDSHSEYRDSVSNHFGMTAELVQHMTESYRDVYQHLASGETSRDLAQLQVLEKLNELQEEINGLPASSPAWWQRTLNSLSARDPRGHAIKGLYLWVGVGRGES